MTIQPSIIVWTIICFCLLMLILNNLLFRPMLGFMDERRARIERAEAKKAEMERSVLEYESRLRESEEAFRVSERERAEEEIKKAREKARSDIAEAEAVGRNRVGLAADDIEYEKKELDDKLGRSVDSLAGEFIGRLIS